MGDVNTGLDKLGNISQMKVVKIKPFVMDEFSMSIGAQFKEAALADLKSKDEQCLVELTNK